MNNEIHVVTGAYGYSGKYIAKRLLDEGYEVRTLTNSYNRSNPFGDRVKAFPFNFGNFEKLVESLREASVLYNTYWVRFNFSDNKVSFKHSIAVENTIRLFAAAKKAGIRRVVHVSITNPSETSHLEYFREKARLEKALIESGLLYAILRPAVLFGKEDILINNIAWILRRFPVFGVFGDGKYRLQPIYVDDLAKLAVEEGKRRENKIINAIGPETFTYRELVKEIGRIIGKERPIISIPNTIGYLFGWVIGKIVGDVIITHEEIEGLKADLLYTNSPPVGETKLTEWARENSSILGIKYQSELARRRNRIEPYERL
ncbi:MAG: NAD-dependent epimerase/dehydratase family protein [Acidobacteriota bacterium]